MFPPAGWILLLLRMVMTAHSVLLMAIRKTTGGGIKTHSKQPVILQRGKAVFTGKEELPRIRISSGYTSVTGTRNTSRSDFEPFEKTPSFIGGVFLCPILPPRLKVNPRKPVKSASQLKTEHRAPRTGYRGTEPHFYVSGAWPRGGKGLATLSLGSRFPPRPTILR